MSKKVQNYETEYFKEDLADYNYSKKYNKYEARDKKRSKNRSYNDEYYYD